MVVDKPIDAVNHEIVVELLHLIDKQFYSEELAGYQNMLYTFKEFIKLKDFFYKFLTVTNKIAGFIMEKENIPFIKALEEYYQYLM